MNIPKSLETEYATAYAARRVREQVYAQRDNALEAIMQAADPVLVKRYQDGVKGVTEANKLVREAEGELKNSIISFVSRSKGDWHDKEVPYAKLTKHVRLEIKDYALVVRWLQAMSMDHMIVIDWDNKVGRDFFETLLTRNPKFADGIVLKSAVPGVMDADRDDTPIAFIHDAFDVRLSSDWPDYEPFNEVPDTTAPDMGAPENPES